SKRRAADVPDDAAVSSPAIYGAGNPGDAVPMLAEAANRPIVSDTVTHIGYGSTGGIVAIPEPIAEETARRALRIFAREPVSRIPVAARDFTKPVFVWRQLHRLKGSERSLPPASALPFR